VCSIYGEEISTAEDSIDLNLDIEPVYIIGDVESTDIYLLHQLNNLDVVFR